MDKKKDWNLELSEYIKQGEPTQVEKTKVWETAIGLQDVDGLKPSKYLIKTAKEHIEGKINIPLNVLVYKSISLFKTKIYKLNNNDNTKIKHRCKRDGYEWYAKPNHILQGRGCPKCCNHIPYTLESFKSALFVVNNAMEVIDEKYINNKTPILVKCKIDGHIWRTTPNALLKGANCPVCAGKTIGRAPEYKNSIWSSQYRDYFSKFLSEEQMKKYMPNS